MEFIVGYLLFFLACYVSFYLPGKLTLLRVFPKLSQGSLSFLSWPTGLSLFLFGIYVFSWIQVPYVYLLILAAVIIYGFFKDRSLFRIRITKGDMWSWGIILLGSLAFLSLTAFSYLQTKTGAQFIGTINVVDGLLHVAYTKSLLTTFPPDHAGLANIPLRGYHYFYDLLMSRLVLFYHFTPQDLYYRYLPLFISLLYGGGFYFLTTKLTGNRLSQRLVLFFAYFSQSFAFLMSFFIHSIGPVAELGSIYPLELILNPAIILSIGMLLSVLYLLFESKPKIFQMVFVGFLFGMITELKVYTGMIGIFILGIILCYRIIKKRHDAFPYLLGLLAMGIIVAVTYIPNNFGAGSLWFSPFFAYSVYMQEPPFTNWHWELQRIIFRDHHNIPHLIVLYAEAVGLFWLLSLGSRIVFLLGLPYIPRLSFWKQEKNIAIIAMIGFPILIGSFFVQSVSIFDTKQFFWIAGALLAIPAGIALGNALSNSFRSVQIAVIALILFLSFGGVYGQVKNFVFPAYTYTVNTSDITFFENVQKVFPPHAFIISVIQPGTSSVTYQPFLGAPTVSAFTGHQTYYESESAQFDLGSIYADRQKKLGQLSAAIALCRKTKISTLVQTIGSHYIVTANPSKCLTHISHITISSPSGLSFYSL